MFSSKSDKKVTLPTLKQLHGQGKAPLGDFFIETIWFPGQYQQVTLVTPDFRIGLDARNEEVQSFVLELTDAVENNIALIVRVTDVQELEWTVIPHDDHEADWKWLGGDSGATCQGRIKTRIPDSANPKSRKKSRPTP